MPGMWGVGMKASMGVSYAEEHMSQLAALSKAVEELPFYEETQLTVNGATARVQAEYLREMLARQMAYARYQLKYWKEKEAAGC